MLDHATRAAILTLKSRGEGIRPIARALRISRGAVRKVLSSGTPEVPRLDRPSRAQPHKEQIKELFAQCKGNLVRVHEELAAQPDPLDQFPLRLAGHYNASGYLLLSQAIEGFLEERSAAELGKGIRPPFLLPVSAPAQDIRWSPDRAQQFGENVTPSGVQPERREA